MPERPRRALATDPASLSRLFGPPDGLLALWIAEPYVPLAQDLPSVLEERARAGWFGYETRGSSLGEAFWSWMRRRHGWDGTALHTSVSPSVGTSIGVLIDLMSDRGDGVILQPPIFTDFKPLVAAAHRRVIKNPLVLDERYRMDADGLAEVASEPSTKMMILCNPHNPVGRVWSPDELATVAEVCATNDVFVIADEIHADLVLPGSRFTPFASVASESGVRWAATHGPIKTFGLAGVCDTLIVSDDEELTNRYREVSSQFHLTRNNVFGIAAFEAAYRSDGTWLDGLLDLVQTNAEVLAKGLPSGIQLVEPEGTYLAWLDFRSLGLDVPELASWLSGSARLALSPGHWFGREGAGFARMTVAAPTDWIQEAVVRLQSAVAGLES